MQNNNIKLGHLSRIREKVIRRLDDINKIDNKFNYCRLEWNDKQQGWHYNFTGHDERAYQNGWVVIFENHIAYADLFANYIDNKRNYYCGKLQDIKKIYLPEILEEWQQFEKFLKMCNEKGFVIYQKHRNFYL